MRRFPETGPSMRATEIIIRLAFSSRAHQFADKQGVLKSSALAILVFLTLLSSPSGIGARLGSLPLVQCKLALLSCLSLTGQPWWSYHPPLYLAHLR